MDQSVGAVDELPALYRVILDLVDELDRSGGRSEANRIRTQTLAAYATSWDHRQQRRLHRLHGRARRAVESQTIAPESRARRP